jgi:CheY-like chemotaxis protein
MTRLIDDLLDVSRIGQGKLELRKKRVELADILERAVESSRPFLDEHGHELIMKLPSAPIQLNADAVRLAQVFMNVLNNAAKYTERGGRVRLAVQRLRGKVIVSVTDNGIGIPPDMQQHLFDMYYQMDHALERSEGGLGIGLTLVRRLVEMHGGTVEVRSEGVGKGSEFLVSLPTVEEAPGLSKWDSPNDESQVSSVRRILVVDDNADLADSFAMLLRMHGNEVQTANDGLEGVQVAERFNPDVVLMDIWLPKVNGFDACRRIREQPWGKRMTLIALTGSVDEEDCNRTKEAGFDHHLVKPVKASDLQRLLNQAKRESDCEAVR